MSFTSEQLHDFHEKKRTFIRQRKERDDNNVESCTTKLTEDFTNYLQNTVSYEGDIIVSFLNSKGPNCFDGSDKMVQRLGEKIKEKFGSGLDFALYREPYTKNTTILYKLKPEENEL